ncbi:MAG: TSUP family transporter [Magnetococcales bacterium]|nr:TSUP family transporter [Magnetococcales bacterium]
MRAGKPTHPVFPFCRQEWKIPAILLVLLFFATIAWGIHLVREHRDQLNMKIFGVLTTDVKPEAPLAATGVAMSAPDINPVRVAVVNIAGVNKAAAGKQASYVSAGSGVIVNPKGFVVTAMHLIQDLAEIQVRVQTPMGPRQYPARMVKVVPEHDLALLKMVSQEIFPYLAIDTVSPIKVGDAVQAWGDPLGTESVQRVGTVDGVDLLEPVRVRDMNLTHLLRTNAVFHWAQNGGPLVNRESHLVGIVLAMEDPAGFIRGYAVPANVLVNHFQDVVTFARKGLSVSAKPDPAFSQPGPPVDRAPRLADQWWQKVRGMLNVGLGKHVVMAPDASTSPPSAAVASDPVHGQSQTLWGYTVSDFLGLLFLGFISGISGGMMTMGGGIIKVTGLMWFFGYGVVLVRPVAYITNIFMYGAAMLRYHRQGLLRFDFCKPLIPWAMVGMVGGYFIGNVMSKTAIQWMLGLFAFLLGIKMLVEIAESRGESGEEEEDRRPASGFLAMLQRFFGTRMDDHSMPAAIRWRHPSVRHGLLGLPMGVISGILGITGGVVEVPLQRYIARMPLRNAIANSATLVFFASIVGTIVAMVHGVQSGSFETQTPLVMAMILTPGAFAGGMVGAWLTSVIPLNMLRWVYAVLMFVIAVRMFMP